MKTLSKYIVGAVALAYYVGCAPVNFEKDLTNNPCAQNANACVVTETSFDWSYDVTVTGGRVDILFVNDNSGSMSFEQRKLADRFANFIQKLDERQVDYRIGMITTDVSTAATANANNKYGYTYEPAVQDSTLGIYQTKNNGASSANGGGGFQDGKLIKFGGHDFLTPSISNRIDLFKSTIVRQETINCETFLSGYQTSNPPDAQYRQNCPSGDERGIFAANLFLKNNAGPFLRENSAFAVIVLADEDVRSGGYLDNSTPLREFDLPQALVKKMRTDFSQKSFKVHSIITDNNTCLNQQYGQFPTYNPITGSIGTAYKYASQSTGGIVGSICSGDYTAMLGDIGTDVAYMSQEIALRCDTPSNLQVTFHNPAQAVGYDLSGGTLRFVTALAPATKLNLKYTCPN